jgi:hypothetical protein
LSSKLVVLKDILEKLGLSGIRFSLRQREKGLKKPLNTDLQQNPSRNNHSENLKERRSDWNNHGSKKVNDKNKLSKLSLFQE